MAAIRLRTVGTVVSVCPGSYRAPGQDRTTPKSVRLSAFFESRTGQDNRTTVYT